MVMEDDPFAKRTILRPTTRCRDEGHCRDRVLVSFAVSAVAVDGRCERYVSDSR